MQRLFPRDSFPTVDRALRYLEIRLGSRPQSAPLMAEVNAVRAKLRKAEDVYQEAVQARVAATAEIYYLDSVLDRTVLALSRSVLAETNGDREHPRYQKLFAVAPSTGMKPVAGDVQDQYVRNILARLQEDADFESVRAAGVDIGKCLQDLNAALEKRRQLGVPEAQAAVERRLALDDARRAYNQAAPRLMLIFQDEALVESYFLDLHKNTKRELEEDQPS